MVLLLIPGWLVLSSLTSSSSVILPDGICSHLRLRASPPTRSLTRADLRRPARSEQKACHAERQ
eukprot:13821529-Heterocapsa_arctica.AAC.1